MTLLSVVLWSVAFWFLLACVRYRNPHMTRHTYATWWLQNGGRLETLSKQLGHARSSTTQDEYVHLERSDVLADLAVIEGRA